MKSPRYDFLKTAGRILNSGQSHSLILTGNIHDLYHLPEDLGDQYVPLVDFLCAQWSLSSKILLVYELNGPIRFVKESDRETLKNGWLKWKTGLDTNEFAIENMLTAGRRQAESESLARSFDENLVNAIGKPTVALEFLRQLCLCSRSLVKGEPCVPQDLIIFVEAGDLVIPEGEINRMSDADRHRVSICHDWFSDPGFINGGDSIILVAESRSLVNHRISRLPQVIEVKAPSPNQDVRAHFIDWFEARLADGESLELWDSKATLASTTAGLSIHALNQLLRGACYEDRPLDLDEVVIKVESFIQQQLGDDVVEFKKPAHDLDDIIGFTHLKGFLRDEFIPRIKEGGPSSLAGAAVCGPIGVGKTFIFEAVARELDMVVLVLKNIRSQWFGQTDVIFERLRRMMDALDRVLVFIDEADTQFGGVGAGTHSTERRLTGKIQQMMSDPQLKGRVTWLLMTARIHLLSPDIRRPGRVGDLIIPVLDPEGDDRQAFVDWVISPVLDQELSQGDRDALKKALDGYSAASFASLRNELKAVASRRDEPLGLNDVLGVVENILPPAIGDTRRYQTLQALVNCTRRSLLPDPTVGEDVRQGWTREVRALEAQGLS